MEVLEKEPFVLLWQTEQQDVYSHGKSIAAPVVSWRNVSFHCEWRAGAKSRRSVIMLSTNRSRWPELEWKPSHPKKAVLIKVLNIQIATGRSVLCSVSRFCYLSSFSFFSCYSGLSFRPPPSFWSLSTGNRDYLGSSRHSVSPGGKVTHSALQLAPDPCRLKPEVPAILTASFLTVSCYRLPYQKLCALPVTPLEQPLLWSTRETISPWRRCLSLTPLKYVFLARQKIDPSVDSLSAPVLLVISSNDSLYGSLGLYILNKPASCLSSRIIEHPTWQRGTLAVVG